MKTEAPPPGPAARNLLGNPSTAELSVDLIRRKLTMLTMLSEQIDLEKAAALVPEFAALAEAKPAGIKAAAMELLAAFNAPLEAPAPPPH